MATLTFLLGGLGLFLLGMGMMTDGLKVAAGGALRTILQRWTNSRLRGLLAGALVTAIVQSSSAVTVAIIGFVNAGLLTLGQSVWVVFGSNVGTTMTGWLVALVGLKVDVGALALPLLGLGMLVRLAAGRRVRRGGAGQAIAGFGAFFLGVGVLQSGFADLAPGLAALDLDGLGVLAIPAFVLLGTLLTVLTQSSSAAMAITLTALAGGAVPLNLAAAAAIGANIGTTSTALLATIGSTPPARRVGAAHVVFNLAAAVAALGLLPVLLWAARAIAATFGAGDDTVETLAVFHTLFNMLGVLLVWPFADRLIRTLSRLYVTQEEQIALPRHLDASLAPVPDLAVRGLILETERMLDIVFGMMRGALDGDTRRQAEAQRLVDGVRALGRAIRDFIARLQGDSLPRAVADAVPDILRAVQHLEDAAGFAAALDGPDAAAPGGVADAHWRALRRALDESIQPDPETADGAPEAEERLRALAEAREDAYQSAKRALLAAAASGAIAIPCMEAALSRAQLLRRCADAAVKARLRLIHARHHAAGEEPATPAATLEQPLLNGAA